MDRFGYLDGKIHQPDRRRRPIRGIANIIRKASTDAGCSLKTNNRSFRWKPADYADLALIGPGAGQVVALGINAEHSLGLLDQPAQRVPVAEGRLAGQPGTKISYAGGRRHDRDAQFPARRGPTMARLGLGCFEGEPVK